MKNEGEGRDKNEMVRMELKYCEHCGGLWVREAETGAVYCPGCELKVAELPAPQVKRGRVRLPIAEPTAIDEMANDIFRFDDDEMDFEAAGGVAWAD